MWILFHPAAKGDPDTIWVWECKGLAPRWSKVLKCDFFFPPLFFFQFLIYLVAALPRSSCQFPTGLILEIYDP